MTINNFDAKAQALRDLVIEALHEQRMGVSSQARSPHAPIFDGTGWQQFHLDTLIDVLKTTDALDVLGVILSAEVAR